jgi:hypothetical protein
VKSIAHAFRAKPIIVQKSLALTPLEKATGNVSRTQLRKTM